MIIGYYTSITVQLECLNNPYLLKVIDLIKSINFSKLDDGIFKIDNNFHYILSTYRTSSVKNEQFAEAHRKYIDFQYVIYGEEKFGYADYSNGKILKTEYNSEKDIEFFKEIENESFLILKKNMYVVFFPEDIHRTGLNNTELRSIRKVIFKVPISNT